MTLVKLLKRGVSPNLKDEIGIPVLQIASQNGNMQMVKFLGR
jgi:ankyrin repeat protein